MNKGSPTTVEMIKSDQNPLDSNELDNLKDDSDTDQERMPLIKDEDGKSIGTTVD